jgi:hypothetical protein
MAFQLSAGVNVSEIDLTTVVPSATSSTGAFAGKFSWGPVNEIVTISDEVRLAEKFGRPTDGNYEYWFSAANFLAYSNNLKVVRAVNTDTSLNASAAGGGVLIENLTDYTQNHVDGAYTKGEFAAKYPGDIGNSIRVEMADGGDNGNTFSTWTHASLFTDTPATSDYVDGVGGANDEIHIVVIDSLGKFTGSSNTVLEKFAFVSKALDAKNSDGTTNYYKDVLTTKSSYIWWLAHPQGSLTLGANTNWGSASSNTSFEYLTSAVEVNLAGGVDGTIVDGDITTAYGQVSNPDSVDVSLIISGPATNNVAVSLISIAEERKDCVVFISPLKTDVVDKYGTEVTNILARRVALTSSSYSFMDSAWKYQYDKYSDVYRWVPLNGDIAGLCARTDTERDPWFSPAGANRGIIKNVVKLSWNPNKTDRDDLYIKGVNPVVTFAGEGTMLYGDKTMLSRPSAFDRINVRRLFIILEKSIARAARSSVFEFNDQFTRAQFVNLVEPYLRDVQGRRGITDFRVVCDETNNTAEVIDRNEFIGDIYIKPARSINFIQLNFVAVRTGVRFEEVVGRF